MIQFKAIELSDKAWIDAFVRAEDSRSADFNFANMFMWDSSYRQLVADLGGRMVAKPKYMQQPFFAFPIGAGDLKTAIKQLCGYSAEHGFPFCVKGVTAQHREQLEALFPGQLRFTEDRDHFDYVYLAEKLLVEANVLGSEHLRLKSFFVLFLFFNELINAVKRHAAVVADDPSATVGVGKTRNNVATTR